MNRRQFLFSFAALSAFGGAAWSAPIPLNNISNYFNRLDTLEAQFVQQNPDGTRSSGTLYIHRPGRARFEYDPPEDALVIAGGGQLAIFDGKSNMSRPEQYPLRQTPLNVILERTVDLARSDVVVGHSGSPDSTVVVAMDPQRPEIGRIALYFSDNPLRLTGWATEDGMGSVTQVQLSNLRTGVDLSSRLFSIKLESDSRR